ncbi:zinc-binding alcohol dehydrogenase family protein [Echinicola jeungdonensis]|uniref:Zinc-binding alcohol dehydrogenase family protein n=1 Tax=Echinicola jeungdonensis TaxID=709343 RepID=A0ABV5J1H0_9BACT|nr:zinc-binding alcohol dehydrogenase family protein [Echinicola jeungdonensis]MDN3668504.1 zinc-binding alcohol dehydrogenase family protein [Echinicola jeungdonensis]
MNILTCDEPGVFTYGTDEKPALESGKAIIKIKRIGICGTDLHAYEGTQPYFNYPRVLGHELAGELVEADGAEGFSPGDLVTIIPYFNCGECVACKAGKPNCCAKISVFGVHEDGGMKEYITVPSSALVKKEGLTLDQLALAEPLAIGAHGVRRAGVNQGEFVLVMGAGPIGLGVMEFARIAGGKVIAMDINEDRLKFCRDVLGVEYTVNATEDFKAQIDEITGGSFAEVIIDATGSSRAIHNGFELLAHGGRYVLVGLQKGPIEFSHPEFHKRESTLMSSRNATRKDFDTVLTALRDKKVKAESYITHQVAFDQVKQDFATWLDPANKVIKAMVNL